MIHSYEIMIQLSDTVEVKSYVILTQFYDALRSSFVGY